MKSVVMTILTAVTLFAYEKGDIVSDDMAAHLGFSGDKVYIVDFFASWCGSCKKEIPLISKVNGQLDPKKVEVIGIDVDTDVEKGVKFQETLKAENNLNFRVINDPQHLIIAEFNPLGMPTLYYVKDKKIVGVITGAVPDIDEQILRDLEGME
ncbi:MAG: TlpA disulfide reductase family protein [Sulfurimonadaceae bacterium]